MNRLQRILPSIILLLMSIFLSSYDYKTEWEEYKSQSDDNPKTAKVILDNIRSNAKKDNDEKQMLKCIVSDIELQLKTDPKTIKQMVKDLRDFQAKIKDPVVMAISQYMEAKLHLAYYERNEYYVNSRTELKDLVPENEEEWSKNIFIDTINSLMDKALSCPQLKTTLSEKYVPLVELKKDSRIYGPYLFDLLMTDRLQSDVLLPDIVDKMKAFDQLVDLHKNDKDKTSYVSLQLSRNSFQYKDDVDKRIEFMTRMLQEYDFQPVSINIRSSLAHELLNIIKNNNQPGSKIEIDPQYVINICNDGIKNFPDHPDLGELRMVIEQMREQKYKLRIPSEYIHHTDSVKIEIEYANIDELKLKLYRIEATPLQFLKNKIEGCKSTFVKDFTFKLKKSNYILQEEATICLPPLDYGLYKIVNEEYRSSIFFVTDIMSITDDNGNLFVVDNKTGEPVRNAKISLYNNQKLESTTYSDEMGYVKLDKSYGVTVANGNDIYSIYSKFPFYKYGAYTYQNDAASYLIITDRSLYRPGQTVNFKCIAYKSNKTECKTLANHKFEVVLNDANYENIAKIALVTNDYGSAAGSFTIPANGLAGEYTINAGDNRININVEEYKRPSFEIEMKKPEATYAFGDSIVVSGFASYLMGTPMANAKVEYTVNRVPSFWCYDRKLHRNGIASGVVETDSMGNFAIPFVAELGKNVGIEPKDICCRYEVTAKMTDSNGETHEESINIFVADQGLVFTHPEYNPIIFFSAFDSTKLALNNIEGLPVKDKKVEFLLKKDGVVMHQGSTITDNAGNFVLSCDKKSPGQYKIFLSAYDDKDRLTTDSFDVILCDEFARTPAVFSKFWTQGFGSFELEENEQKHIRIGSSLNNAYLLLTKRDKKDVVEKKWIKLDNEIMDFSFVLEKDQDYVAYNFYLVHNGKLNVGSLVMEKKAKDMTLPLTLETFRDKVQPGSTEKWTIKVPASRKSEVLALMYDASLDLMRPYHMDDINLYKEFFSNSVLYANKSWYPDQIYFYTPINYEFYNIQEFDELSCHFNFPYSYDSYDNSVSFCVMGGTAKMSKRMAAAPKAEMCMDMAFQEESMPMEEDLMPEFHIRKNFAETAFFYPQMHPDEDGNLDLTFTMPESLTKWEFIAFAHTNDLYSNKIMQEIVTRKELMISPNYPRFLRVGDKCVFSAKVINLSDQKTAGKAKLQILDAVTESVISEYATYFDLAAEETAAVRWRQVDIPSDKEAVIVRVIALTDNMTDAEQKMLPILSDKIVITQSLPIYARGDSATKFVMKNLANSQSKTLESRFLKLEVASNPIWFAIQSLPTTANVNFDNSISLSAAIFSSMLANSIATSNPKIFNVIQMWKSDKNSLLSNLERNQDVKNVLLNESPWVMEGKSEKENKERLATLFDINTLRNNTSTWVDKLSKLQNEDGGYAWFDGMSSGLYTTLFVLDNNARLRADKIDCGIDQNNIKKAVKFIDNQMVMEYKTNKKQWAKNKYGISTTFVYLVSVRSCYSDIVMSNEVKEAYNTYVDLIANNWSKQDLCTKAYSAIVLHRFGKKDEAKKVVKSIREFSSTSDELGMYWPIIANHGFLNSAIATHTRIMEALQIVDPDQKEQEMLRFWLLSQKRSNDWGNTIANIDALRVLLVGNKWLDIENKTTVKLGNQVINTADTGSDYGYFTKYIDKDSITSDMATVEMQNAQGGNMSWGALHWQYLEEMNNVEDNATGLSVKKELFVQTTDNSGKNSLTLVKDNTVLSVGDKIVVRMVVSTDRDLDYVSLKDQRASCLEPTETISHYTFSQGVGYYQSFKDAATYFFFGQLPKGTYVFEYPLHVTHAGQYTNGVASVQCLYAPEFSANSKSVRIEVK